MVLAVIAVILAAVWLLVVWRLYLRGSINSQELAAYAMFGTAFATLLLAFGTFWMANENRKIAKQNRELVEANKELVKQNNILISRDYIAELMVNVIEPMLGSVNSLESFFKERQHHWRPTGESSVGKDLREILGNDLKLFEVPPSSQYSEKYYYLPLYLQKLVGEVNQTYYRNFKERNPQLCQRIEDFDNKPLGFNQLLFDLAKDIVSHHAINVSLRYEIELNESREICDEIRLACAYFAFMKLIGSEKDPSELPTNLGTGVHAKATKHWESKRKCLIKEISESLAEKPDRILRECETLKESLAKIKEALLEEQYRYKTNFAITDEKLGSAREVLRPKYLT